MILLTFLYVLTTGALLGVAVWAGVTAKKQLELGNQIERNRTRPYVIFDLVTERSCIFAFVKTIGQTPAAKVQIRISPELKIPIRAETWDVPFIVNEVSLLHPGRELKCFIEHWNPFLKQYPDLKFQGTIAYEGFDGSTFGPESFLIDLNSQRNIVYLGNKTLHEIGGSLEEMTNHLRNIREELRKSPS
jgi:hypothetical protein